MKKPRSKPNQKCPACGGLGWLREPFQSIAAAPECQKCKGTGVATTSPNDSALSLSHVVSFSGGACSFWAAARVVERYGAENVTLLFADTKMEDEDLYRFLRDAVQYLGVPLTTIADGRTPWQVFSDEGMMGNSRVDLCSRILKRELLDRWHRAACLEMTSTLYVGIDWTEEHRLHRLRARKPGWRIEAPMCEAPLWDKCRMTDELRKIGIEPPRLYKLGFPHNNCGGFCIKAGQAHFAHLLKVMPERYAQHEANEEAMRARLGDVSVMKDRRGGTQKSATSAALVRCTDWLAGIL